MGLFSSDKDIDPRTGKTRAETAKDKARHDKSMARNERDSKRVQRDLNSRVQKTKSIWS